MRSRPFQPPALHSRLTTEQLEQLLGCPAIPGTQVEGHSGSVALVQLSEFATAPNFIKVPFTAPAQGWFQRLFNGAGGNKSRPPSIWLVVARTTSDTWIWLGEADCHSWSLDNLGNASNADLLLAKAIPKADFLKLRNDDPWMTTDHSIALDGGPGDLSSVRLRSAHSQDRGQVFVNRWEGDQFGLQFNETVSVFYVLNEGLASPDMEYAICPVVGVTETQNSLLEMLCPCCGIPSCDFPANAHMPREFGFYVLERLLEDQKLPEFWPAPPEDKNKIVWTPSEILEGAHA